MNINRYRNVQEIRFLPNDKETFPALQDIRFFLNTTMKNRNGIYNYPNLSMRCPTNTLVFFQYDGTLVASAVLKENIKGVCYDEEGNKYAGHYLFDMNTMIVFDSPISAREIRDIDPSFINFSQCKRKTDVILLDELLKLIDRHI